MSLILMSASQDSIWRQRAAALSSAPHTFQFFEDEERLFRALQESSPAAVIIGATTPREADLKLINKLARTISGLPLLLASERLSSPLAFQAARSGATHLLTDLLSNQEFLERIDQAIHEVRERAAEGGSHDADTGLLTPHSIKTLREVVQEHMTRALSACRGNRSRAAKLLGIDRSTLRRRLNEIESGSQIEI